MFFLSMFLKSSSRYGTVRKRQKRKLKRMKKPEACSFGEFVYVW